MIRFFKNPFVLLVLCSAFCVAGAHVAYAVISLTLLQNGSFGTIQAPATISGPQYIEMGGNGVITCPGGWTCPATGTPMAFNLTGMTNGTTYVFGCDTGNQEQNTTGAGFGATTLPAGIFRIMVPTALAPGSGTLCTGLANNAILSWVATGTTSILYVDVKIDATHAQAGGVFNLANSGNPFNAEGEKSGGTEHTSVNADITVTFASLMGIASTTDMAFGKNAFSGMPAVTDHVDLGTNGTAAFAGNFVSMGGALAAGQVVMNNVQNGVTVQVQCGQMVHLTNAANTHWINVTGLKVAAQGSTGTYAGAGVLCPASIGTVATTMLFNSVSANTFFFGGKLDGSTASGLANEAYSSHNPGGTSATVIVLNQ